LQDRRRFKGAGNRAHPESHGGEHAQRQEQRVAGFQFGDLRVLQGSRETREFFIIGIGKINHTDRLTGWRDIERTDIQIAQLIGREYGEAAASGGDAGQIVGQVKVGRNAGTVADPDIDQRIAGTKNIEIVFGAKAGQIIIDGR